MIDETTRMNQTQLTLPYSTTPLLRQSICSITCRYTNRISIDNTDPIVVGIVIRIPVQLGGLPQS